jgi:hypothetical protein
VISKESWNMKITVSVGGAKRAATRPFETADHVMVAGVCPLCGIEPFKVRGTGVSRNDHDSYYADAECVACSKFVGTIRAKFDTIFGIEEDERVLNGLYEVY